MMSKKDKIYLGIIVVISLLYIGYQVYRPQQVDWSPSFTRLDKIPFGTYILENELETLFPGQEIRVQSISPYEYLLRSKQFDDRNNWIFINNVVAPDPNELSMILDRVEAGDHLFISASNPGGALPDSLGFSVTFQTLLERRLHDTTDSLTHNTNETFKMNLSNLSLRSEKGWDFEGQRVAYFSRVDTAITTILGEIEGDRANFIRMDRGKGVIYIHLFPLAFTNYYVRDQHHAEYAFKSLSYLPVRDVIWDEYYKAGRERYTTPMGYVLGVPSLRNAWFLALAGVILFMIFKGRREQRAIPVQEKPKNSTLEFTRTIGSLYFEKGTHKDIAEKKIRFFKDYCRRNLCIHDAETNLLEANIIARRSGVPLKQVTKLLNMISNIQQQKDVSKEELKQVTSQIDQFYKENQR